MKIRKGNTLVTSWQEQCAEVINFMEGLFKDVKYRIVFRKANDEWSFIVESIRNDGGKHHGDAINWVSVSGKCVETLPELLLLKAQKEVNEWQALGLKEVQKHAVELEKAKIELDRRLNIHLESLTKKINNGSQAGNSDSP